MTAETMKEPVKDVEMKDVENEETTKEEPKKDPDTVTLDGLFHD